MEHTSLLTKLSVYLKKNSYMYVRIYIYIYILLPHLNSFVFFVCGLGVSLTSLLYIMLFRRGNIFERFDV